MISFSLFVQPDQYERYRSSLYSHMTPSPQHGLSGDQFTISSACPSAITSATRTASSDEQGTLGRQRCTGCGAQHYALTTQRENASSSSNGDGYTSFAASMAGALSIAPALIGSSEQQQPSGTVSSEAGTGADRAMPIGLQQAHGHGQMYDPMID